MMREGALRRVGGTPPTQERLQSIRPTYVDAAAFAAIVIIAMGACWTLSASFLIAEFAIYGSSLAYLWVRSAAVRDVLEARFLVKATLFCAIFYTYVGVRYEGWTGPSAFPLVFGVPVEQALWGALVIPLSIAVNQRFFAIRKEKPPLPYTRVLVYLLFTLGLAVALLPQLRGVMDGFVYLKIGLILYPPIFILALKLERAFWRELFLTGIVFLCVHLGFEMLAMQYGYWEFGGEYVGWINVFNNPLPVEEVLLIIALSSPCVVAVHALRCNWKGIARPGHPR
jgi:hypothetical protein